MTNERSVPDPNTVERIEQVLSGNRRALARLLTEIESESEGIEHVLAALFSHTGRAWIIGITGAPGTGKSTLVTALAKAYRAANRTVAIVAVDPTSPFTGGAILGDRIRMRDLSGDSGVFIRSMATRGSLGGLARATRDAVRALDAAGFNIVLVETVGAGQSEVDIARMANTTVVVEAPGLGDDVQAIKAGILEIADVLVINKADRPGVNTTLRALRTMLELGHPSSRAQLNGSQIRHHGKTMTAQTPTAHPTNHTTAPLWIPPIIQTVASEDKGIDELVNAIEAHRAHLHANEIFAEIERRQIEIELYDRLRESLMNQLIKSLPEETFNDLVRRVQTREVAPQHAVRTLLHEASGRGVP